MSDLTTIRLVNYGIIVVFALAMIAATIIPMRFGKKAVSSRKEDSDSVRNLHRDVRDAQEDYDIPQEAITEFFQYFDTLTSDKGRRDAVNHFIKRHEKLHNQRLAAERAEK